MLEECLKGMNKQAVHFGDNGRLVCRRGGICGLWSRGAPAEAPAWPGAGGFCPLPNELENTIALSGCENRFGPVQPLSCWESPELISFVRRAQHILAEAEGSLFPGRPQVAQTSEGPNMARTPRNEKASK